MEACNLCPRRCSADRRVSFGLCGGGSLPKVARAALHFGEEPCISGEKGSGTVFFSGCPLGCIFCQNRKISADNFGAEVTVARLSEIFLELQGAGAHNINLVSASHYAPWIVEALDGVRGRLQIPVVYNSSAYENVETLKMLDGYINVYLPDLKYRSNSLAARLSGVSDYFETAVAALREMFRQVGSYRFGADGTLRRGLVVRHLILPGHNADSVAVFEALSEICLPESILISVMSQYTPPENAENPPAELMRRLSAEEYEAVLTRVHELGFDGYEQELSSAEREYTPAFDLTGVWK